MFCDLFLRSVMPSIYDPPDVEEQSIKSAEMLPFPNITLNYSACGENLTIACSTLEAPIEIYATSLSDVADHNGTWLFLANRDKRNNLTLLRKTVSCIKSVR